MSIETLLEAARFVELSAQIGHGARGLNDQEIPNYGANGQIGPSTGDLRTASVTVTSSPSSSPGSNKSFSPGTSYGSHQLSTSNTDTLEEGDEKRSGTREVHNKLEKNRRAHLKECFDNLRDSIPNMDDKKMKPSNLSILQGALRYLQALKRKERELEYETERLARQKIQYQEKLAKLSGCSLPPWKKTEPEVKEEEEEPMEEDNEEDRDSVSTSTSTASEAEEEERKSRAQSPEVRLGQSVQNVDKTGHVGSAVPIRTNPLPDHVIKVTQSVKEQSGPFVISRQIVTHLPVSSAASVTGEQQPQQLAAAHKTAAAKLQQQQQQQQQPSSNHKKGQLARAKGPQWVVGAKHIEPVNEISQLNVPRMAHVVTQRVATTQKVIVHPQVGPQQVNLQPAASPKPAVTKQTPTTLKQANPPANNQVQQVAQPKITGTSHVVRQFDSHSSAVSAVQEHLKNRAQNKLPQQPKQPVRTISHTTPTTDSLMSSKGNVTVVNTAAAANTTTSSGVTRQTVSQLLGKQPMVIRQPVRRTDNKYVMQRVVRHPFSPRSQTVDIMPKSPTNLSSNDATKNQLSTPATITMVTTSVTSSYASGSANKQGIIALSTVAQQQTAPSTVLDMRNLISHNVILPPVPQYLPAAGIPSSMLRTNLTNPSVLNAANAALLSQGMLANTRNMTPQLSLPGSKDTSQTKLHPPVSGPLSFLSSPVTQQTKVSSLSPGKQPSLPYSGPLTPVHPFLAPGLAVQPALTQVLFTQPPIATYTVANSLVKTTMSSPAVIRHPIMPAVGADSSVDTTTVTTAGTSGSITQTTAAVTMPPVVTIGAVSFNPLLGANRALGTAPTYTTLSFGQYQNYGFPLAGQVPFISPVAFTGNPSSAAVPGTSVGNQTIANGKASNGVIVHTVAVPAAIPVTSAWLNSTTISNGIPVKDLTQLVPTTTSSPTSVTMVPTAGTISPIVSSSQEGNVSDSKTMSGSTSVTKTTS